MLAVESADRWSIEIDGFETARVSIDRAVTLLISEGDVSFEVRIGNPFVLRDAQGDAVRLAPEGDPLDLAPVLPLVRAEPQLIEAFKNGALVVLFKDGQQLNVAALTSSNHGTSAEVMDYS